jgi:hypothetical protein
MMLVQVELVSHRQGRSTIKCTWRIRHGMIARMLWKLPKYETLEVTYIGNCTIWRNLETYQRVSTQLEARLCDVEAKMLTERERIAQLRAVS